jgi:hypothetical protein
MAKNNYQYLGFIVLLLLFFFIACNTKKPLLPKKIDKNLICRPTAKLPPIDFTPQKDSTLIAIFKSRPLAYKSHNAWLYFYTKNNYFYSKRKYLDFETKKFVFSDYTDTLHYNTFNYNIFFDLHYSNYDERMGWVITDGDTLYNLHGSNLTLPATIEKAESGWYYRVANFEIDTQRIINYNNCCKINDINTLFRGFVNEQQMYRFYIDKDQYYVDLYGPLYIWYHIPLKCSNYRNGYKFIVDGKIDLDGLHPFMFEAVGCNYYYPKEGKLVKEFIAGSGKGSIDTIKVTEDWDYQNSRVDSSFFNNSYDKQLKVYEFRKKNNIWHGEDNKELYKMQK